MRSRKTVESGSASRTTEYFYTGSQLTAERDSDGTLYRYLYGPGGAPLEVVVTTGTVTARYALQTDALGSVVAISSEGGLPVATYAYDPWGAPLATTLVITCALDRAVVARQPFRYRGYTLDAETGLYYLPARYYDPETARFLSPDPAAPSAGAPASLNPYVYCQDDPIGASDPTGAIMDADDDGKVDPYEYAAHYYAHSKKGTAAKAKWLRTATHGHKAWKAQRASLEDRLARMAMAQARVAASLAAKAPPSDGSLNLLAGGLAGLSAVATTVATVAGTVALAAATTAAATSPAALTGGGAVVPGTAAALAADAAADRVLGGGGLYRCRCGVLSCHRNACPEGRD